MRAERVRKLTPYFWFVAGIIDIAIALDYFSKDPAGIKWIGYTFLGGGFIINGIAWYAKINRLSKKLVILSGMLFGMVLSLLSVYRANFITFGYDLASSVGFVLGMGLISACAAANLKLRKIELAEK
ncbi:MAG: hypothetical protein PWR13_1367 [Archaeoglobi archaeon]|nr:hypothetical protein [Archaeoglobi archaeon]MDK2782339.1 hypothetical protein [Archaeoglobi archaeon]